MPADLAGVAGMVIPLPAGYRVADTLAYHGRDPLSVSERLSGDVLEKPLLLGGVPTLLTLDFTAASDPASPHVAIRRDRLLDAAGIMELDQIARRMLGLQSDALAFEAMASAGTLAAARTGLRLPLTATPFEAVCWAVIGQQINLTFAAALRRAMIQLAGRPHAASGLVCHPSAADVAALDPAALTGQRFSRAKARYLVGVATAIAAGEPSLEALAALPQAEAERALTALTGIGTWTARYILLRGFGFPDMAPIGDSGLAAGLQRLLGLDERPNIAAQEAAMQAFAPHRSLATLHLWAILKDQPGTKSRKPTTLASRPSSMVAKSVPPATSAPEAGPSVQLKRRRSP